MEARLERFARIRFIGPARECRPDEFSGVVVNGATEVDCCLRAAGRKPHHDLVASYRVVGPGRFQVCVGRPEPDGTPGGLPAFELPAGDVVTSLHVGPYQQLSRAWDACFARMDAHQGHKPAPAWEIYHHREDPAASRTTVQVLFVKQVAGARSLLSS